MAPRLNEWSCVAARLFGLYSGINEAIKIAPQRHLPLVHHADEILKMLAFHCIVRVSAVLDRQDDLSFQSAFRFLQSEGSLRALAIAYAAAPPISPVEDALEICGDSAARFMAAYGEIPWGAFARLQSFRNRAIAHVGWSEARRFVKFGELEHLVRIVSVLGGELMLMTTGLNRWPVDYISAAQDGAQSLWTAIFEADAQGRLGL